MHRVDLRLQPTMVLHSVGQRIADVGDVITRLKLQRRFNGDGETGRTGGKSKNRDGYQDAESVGSCHGQVELSSHVIFFRHVCFSW